MKSRGSVRNGRVEMYKCLTQEGESHMIDERSSYHMDEIGDIQMILDFHDGIVIRTFFLHVHVADLMRLAKAMGDELWVEVTR